MLPIKNILAPVDFSEQSCASARYAVALADHFRALLTLLYVQRPERDLTAMDLGLPGPAWELQPADLARRRLDGVLRPEPAGVRIERVVLEGDPAGTIVAWARERGADLVVLPTHGHGPFRRFLLGSVTAKVLHDAACPVWTGVHLEQAPPIESVTGSIVVCGVDLGPQGAPVVRYAARMAEEFRAGFVVVHALPALEAAAGECFSSHWRAALENQACSRIEDLLAEAGARAEVLVACGDPPRVLRCAAERRRAALVVIGRGSAAGVFGRLRANAYAILRESPCPVLSV